MGVLLGHSPFRVAWEYPSVHSRHPPGFPTKEEQMLSRTYGYCTMQLVPLLTR